MAARLAELLMSHSRFVNMMLRNPGDTPPPLPKLAASLQRPLSSTLPLVELDPEEKPVCHAPLHVCLHKRPVLLQLLRHPGVFLIYPRSHSPLFAHAQLGASLRIMLVQVISGKGELIRLLGVLLQLHRLHIPGELPSSLQDGLRGLLPALLSSYGASFSSTDRAMLQLLLLVNSLLCEQESADSSAEDTAALHISLLFSGPLAKAG